MTSPHTSPAALSEEQIAEMERLERLATPGPWAISYTPHYGISLVADDGTPIANVNIPLTADDATLIAVVRNALPALLASRSSLLKHIGELEAAQITSEDQEALSHGLTLLAEMSRLTRNAETRNDSISVHWYEHDGARAGAAFGVLSRLLDASRANAFRAASQERDNG